MNHALAIVDRSLRVFVTGAVVGIVIGLSSCATESMTEIRDAQLSEAYVRSLCPAIDFDGGVP